MAGDEAVGAAVVVAEWQVCATVTRATEACIHITTGWASVNDLIKAS